ncbi:transposase [Sporosarcina highlanderae]|uniref:Transposase n=1 Tax=Sporosarcina highlanderae TaxID=3035916 RepID=A0ABT8JSB1_9BACL|nr:transposase [Sporosarcina highlanderae]MDN4607807.1 transposase [Sporosarcina highlanderae]
MDNNKVRMYVSIANQQIYSHKHDSPWEYEVEMSREFLPVFNQLFTQIDRLEFSNFLRGHSRPFLQYHYDRDNHGIDLRTMKLYALIHEFTDDETKKFIERLPYFTKGNPRITSAPVHPSS